MGANFAVRFVVIVVWRFAAVEELSNASGVSLHVDKSAFAQCFHSFLNSPVGHIEITDFILVIIIIG